MADALPELDGTVDLVIANPPYIPLEAYASVPPEVRDHDPALALFSGHDGLDAIRVVAATAARLLRPGGLRLHRARRRAGRGGASRCWSGTAPSAAYATIVDLTGRPRFVTAVRTLTRARAMRPATSDRVRRSSGTDGAASSERAGRRARVRGYRRFDCTGDDPGVHAAATEAARQAVEAGECIVLPTDTVYGIGADAFSADAVQRLLDAKGRGRDMPPPVLIGEPSA